MADFRVRVQGLGQIHRTISALGPSFEQRILGPSLGAMAGVVRRRAGQKDFGFTDGTGVRPFDKARGKTESRRLRKTIRSRRIAAYYGGRRYKSGRAGVFAGGPGARHAHLVELGHGGPFPAKPHSFLVRALIETEAQGYTAFVRKAQERFGIAVAVAMRGRSARGAVSGRTFARRGRRG